MKTRCVVVLALLALVMIGSNLYASSTVGAASASPTSIRVTTPTTVAVTWYISDATVLPQGINLLCLNANGSTTILGQLHDDGQNGDVSAGDKIFTLLFTFNEPSTGQIRLQLSAAFKGVLKRVLSNIITINVNDIPPTLGLTLDQTHSSSQLIGLDGGTISTVASNGENIVLTIPQGALFSPIEITITPILSITGLPFDGGLIGGVSFSPAGTILGKTATLNITPPTRYVGVYHEVGFAYEGNGTDFHLVPLTKNADGSYTLTLSQFSGYGVGAASDQNIIQASASTQSKSGYPGQIDAILASAQARGGGLSSADMAKIHQLLSDWYQQVVLPYLQSVVNCLTLGGCSVNEPNALQDLLYAPTDCFLQWAEAAVQFDYSDSVSLFKQFRSIFEPVFDSFWQAYDQSCSNLAKSNFCSAVCSAPNSPSPFDQLTALGVYAQQFGIEVNNPDVRCGGILNQLVQQMGFVSAPYQVMISQTLSPQLAIKSETGGTLEQIPPGTQIVWTSDDPAIASVDSVTGTITGISTGSTQIRVKLTQCNKTFEATATVSVNPVQYGGTIVSTGILFDQMGDVWQSTEQYNATLSVDGHTNSMTLTGSISGQVLFCATGYICEGTSEPVNLSMTLTGSGGNLAGSTEWCYMQVCVDYAVTGTATATSFSGTFSSSWSGWSTGEYSANFNLSKTSFAGMLAARSVRSPRSAPRIIKPEGLSRPMVTPWGIVN